MTSTPADERVLDTLVDRTYKNVESWYTSADDKAQILLTVNGVLLTVFASTVVGTDAAGSPGIRWWTWSSFLLAGVAIVFSIILASMCLTRRPALLPTPYMDCPPINLWFYNDIAGHTDSGEYAKRLEEHASGILVHQIHPLARSVRWKHALLRWGFWFLTGALVLLALGAASYLRDLQ